MVELVPVTRIEQQLDSIVNAGEVLADPVTRIELMLDDIVHSRTTVLHPITKNEIYLAKISGADVEIPEPVTRIEFYLAAIAGMDVEVPEPVTRIEFWLAEWAEQGGGGTITAVTGTLPLTLADALSKAIRSITQYGKCTTTDVDIYCNNGKLVAIDDELPGEYKRITGIKFDGDFWYETNESLSGDDDVTMTLANTSTTGQNVFGSYNGTSAGSKNFSLYIYGGGSTSSSYFRYGSQLVRPKYGSNEQTITFGKNGTSGFATDVIVTPDDFETPANAYIGMLPNSSSPAYTGSIMGNILVSDRLKYIPCERVSDGAIGYYEATKGIFLEKSGTGTPIKGSYDESHLNDFVVVGTPEVITLSASGAQDQTASAVNLYATNDVADEQDIISGKVTHNTEVVVSGGVFTIQALANPVVEYVTAQHLRTTEGTNIVSVTANVSGIEATIEYTAEGE